MTTIAYRNGIIAADTGITCGSTRDCFAEKIAKRKDGAVAGACGELWWISAFLKWFKDGGDQVQSPGVNGNTGFIATKRRVLTVFEAENNNTYTYEVTAPYYAIGSGRMVALGAMHAGAHPVDAVKAAIAHNDGTYGRVMSLKVGW